MPHHPSTDFLVTDNARARWVRRSETSQDFVTVEELAVEAAAPPHPQGVAFESGGGRFNIEEKRGAAVSRRYRFADTLAEAINRKAAHHQIQRLSLVGPPRTLAAIRRRLTPEAQAVVVGSLHKDLTKTPDHELGAWLNAIPLQ
ncbi:MAG: host attachment protein [Caulobacteraceae bacterium]